MSEMYAPMGAAPAAPSVDDAISALRSALESDGRMDAAERLLFEQVTTLIAKFQAGREKQEQAALGGGPATQFLRRSSGA